MWSEDELKIIRRLDNQVQQLAIVHSTLSVTELIAAETTWRTVKEVWELMKEDNVQYYGIYLAFYSAIVDSLVESIVEETNNQFERIVNND